MKNIARQSFRRQEMGGIPETVGYDSRVSMKTGEIASLRVTDLQS
jgi:hypothetical protein